MRTVSGLTIKIHKTTGEYFVTQLSGQNWSGSSSSLSFTLVATVENATIEKVFGISKSKAGEAGESAKLLYLTSDSQTFVVNSDGQPSPSDQTITFNASLQNITSPVTWTVSKWVLTPSPGWVNLTGTTASNAITNVSSTSISMSWSQFSTAADGQKFVKIKASAGGIFDEITIVRMAEGPRGASGFNAKTVKLESTSYQISYTSAGTNPSPASITLSASQQNHEGTIFYEFLAGATSLQNTTSNTLTRSFSDIVTSFGASGAPITYIVRTREESNSGTIVSTDSVTVAGTREGASTVSALLTNSAHVFPAAVDGTVSSYADGATDIIVFSGNNKLTATTKATNGELLNGEFRVSAVASDITVSAGNTTFSGNTGKEIRFTPSAMIQDSAKITYTIAAKDSNGTISTLTQIQTFTKSRKGDTGAQGENAKTVSLIASTYQIVYDGDGRNPNPSGNITLTATAINHTSPTYTFDYSTNNGSSYVTTNLVSSTNTATINATTAFSTQPSVPVLFRVRSFEGATQIATATISIAGTKAGVDSFNALLSNENVSLVFNPDGIVDSTSYTNGATEISLWRGKDEYTGVVATSDASISSGQFYISNVQGSGISTTTTNGATVAGKKVLQFVPTNWTSTGETASITYTIRAKDPGSNVIQLTKIQTFSKAKAGRAILHGTGTPTEISTASRALWTSSASTLGSAAQKYPGTDAAEAGEDWDEVNTARSGDRYIDLNTGVTWIKSGSTWTSKNRGFLSGIVLSGSTTNGTGSLSLKIGKGSSATSGSFNKSTFGLGKVENFTRNEIATTALDNIFLDTSTAGTVKLQKQTPGTSTKTTIGNINKTLIGLSNVANDSPDTIRAGVNDAFLATKFGVANLSAIPRTFSKVTPYATQSVLREAGQTYGPGLIELNVWDIEASIQSSPGWGGIRVIDFRDTSLSRIPIQIYNYGIPELWICGKIANQGSLSATDYRDNPRWVIAKGIGTHDLHFSTIPSSGVGGASRGYLSATSGVGVIDFTGQHRNIPHDASLLDKKNVGLIAVSTGKYDNPDNVDNEKDNIQINESLPIVKLSDRRNQKSVFGVISSSEDQNDSNREYRIGNFVSIHEKKSKEDNRLVVNSLGEGAVWVCNINGSLENGDYITSCEIPGYGMRQDDDILHSYTVAKITCDCDFDLNSEIYHCEEFEWEGKTYRRAFVGCTYHCG
jgi:hypothetical protein